MPCIESKDITNVMLERSDEGGLLVIKWTYNVKQGRFPTDSIRFVMTTPEAEFIAAPKMPFIPMFRDLGRVLDLGMGRQLTVFDGFYNSPHPQLTVTVFDFRLRDFINMIRKGLTLPNKAKLDITEDWEAMVTGMVPNVIEDITPAADARLTQRGNIGHLQEWLGRVRSIAKNHSQGQDNPAKLFIMTSNELDFYWEVHWTVESTGESRVYNGGINWDGENYSVNT